MTILSNNIPNKGLVDCLGANLTVFVLAIFKTNLLAANQLVMWDKVPVTLCLRAQ
jgi:hypothetical protein